MENPESARQGCTLCSGGACPALFFKRNIRHSNHLPSAVISLLYGLPLLCLLLGAMIGDCYGELMSMMGAGIGLILAFIVLRTCQHRLNRLCLQKSTDGDL